MDSFEVNKILGALLGTMTFTLGLAIASEIIFDAHEPEKPGYELAEPAPDGGGGAAPAAVAVEPIAARLQTADAAKGEAVSKQCGSCHSFEKGGPNKVGPNLYGVVGNHHAHLEGFSYSSAMKEKVGDQWTYEALDAFLENPRGAIPGTAMSFAGVKRPDQRANLIAWLNQNSDNPLPKPDAPPPAEGAAPADASAPADAPAPNAADGAAPPASGETGGPTSVPEPQQAPSGVAPTPPSGAPEGGTPEMPQGGAGNQAPAQLPATGTPQPQPQPQQ